MGTASIKRAGRTHKPHVFENKGCFLKLALQILLLQTVFYPWLHSICVLLNMHPTHGDHSSCCKQIHSWFQIVRGLSLGRVNSCWREVRCYAEYWGYTAPTNEKTALSVLNKQRKQIRDEDMDTSRFVQWRTVIKEIGRDNINVLALYNAIMKRGGCELVSNFCSAICQLLLL